MKLKKFLVGLLGSTLKMPEDEVASLLNEDEKLKDALEADTIKDTALDVVSKKNADHIAALKAKEQENWDNKHGKLKKEILNSYEKEIREEYGIDSDAKGKELIKKIVELNKGDGSIDEAKVKAHPVYQQLIEFNKGEVQKVKDAEKKKYDQKVLELQRVEINSQVRGKFDPVIDSLKPKFEEDQTIARNQRDRIHNEALGAFDWSIVEGANEPIPLKKGTTERATDPHGHDLDVKSVLQNITSKYHVLGFEGGGSPTPRNNGSGGAGAGSGDNPYGKRIKDYETYKSVLSEISKDPSMNPDQKDEATAKALEALNALPT